MRVNTRNYPLLMLVFDVVEILFLGAIDEFLGTIRIFGSVDTCFVQNSVCKFIRLLFYEPALTG